MPPGGPVEEADSQNTPSVQNFSHLYYNKHELELVNLSQDEFNLWTTNSF